MSPGKGPAIAMDLDQPQPDGSKTTRGGPQQTLKFDREYAKWKEPFGDMAQVPPCRTPHELRRYNEEFTRFAWAQLPPQPSIARTKHRFKALGGEIDMERFATAEQMSRGREALQPAILFLHGGGMVAMSVDIYAPRLAQWAAESGMQIFAVDYRLAPEYMYPIPMEDCYSGLVWLSEHGPELGVDPARLGLMGDSAGGTLAASVSLVARDRYLNPPIAKQILIYPMLDDRCTVSPSGAAKLSGLKNFASLSQPIIKMCWEAYLGKEAGNPDERAHTTLYAVPGRAKDLRGLPSTYIDVGGLDLFRAECAFFAARLAEADVEVEFHLFPGVSHGFEAASEIGVAKRAMEGRFRWMRDL